MVMVIMAHDCELIKQNESEIGSDNTGLRLGLHF